MTCSVLPDVALIALYHLPTEGGERTTWQARYMVSVFRNRVHNTPRKLEGLDGELLLFYWNALPFEPQIYAIAKRCLDSYEFRRLKSMGMELACSEVISNGCCGGRCLDYRLSLSFLPRVDWAQMLAQELW